MTEHSLNSLISIQGRFHRSVHIVRDWHDQKNIEHYVLTPTAKEAVLKVLNGVTSYKENNVWSITGPYGTGKSSYLLFLTDLLCNDPAHHPEAALLREKFSIDHKKFIPVLSVGKRVPLKAALLAALREQAAYMLPSILPSINNTLSSDVIDDTSVVSIFEDAIECSTQAGYKGILLIIDEFGKFLEFAAKHPDTEDIFVLQELAEMASRAKGSFVFITVLHSSFEGYLPSLSETYKIEWKKIQGRFVDIPFLEPPEQFLSLIGDAIVWDEDEEGIRQSYQKIIRETIIEKPLAESARRFNLDELLPRCVPIDPITTLILWPLFRSKLSQNERSLFAFLMDRGPFGFQEFLSITPVNPTFPDFYRLDRLYDYVTNTLGSAILLGDQTKRWAEVEHSLDRIPSDAPKFARSVVKAIGLIHIYGAVVGLSASRETLACALGNEVEVDEALSYLDRLSIIVFRQFTGAYALWEGSDVDLDVQYKEAQSYIGRGNLSARLKKIVSIRPFVARAHYIQKGVLRFFSVDVIDANSEVITEVMKNGLGESDGRLIFVLSPDLETREKSILLAEQLTNQTIDHNQQLIFAFPNPMLGLENRIREVEAWTWIKMNVQALQGDPVARKEVDIRLANALQKVFDQAGQILGLRGYVFDPSQTEWIQGGTSHDIPNSIRFQQWLSEIFDQVFCLAPTLHNELINRDHLSSAAISARRLLIEAMVEREGIKELGITGTPAEMSMYKAMLYEGGFHQYRDGHWMFVSPNENWFHVWEKMNEFLNNARDNRRPILDLLDILKNPPFGLREGPFYVLLTALILFHKDHLALYEDNLFVSDLRVEVFERLTRMPKTFEVQLYELSGRTREAVSALGHMLDNLRLADHKESFQLVDVVKPLILFVLSLPEFSKKTKRLDFPQAIKVRDSLLKTSDPYSLIFDELPKAVEMGSVKEGDIQEFINRIKESIFSLQDAYPTLLNEIESQIRNVFGLSGTAIEVQQQLQKRAKPLVEWAIDRRMIPFIRAAADEKDERDWREVLATAVLQGRPPYLWLDSDMPRFQVLLRQMASDFLRLEELVAERNGHEASKILRVGVLDRSVTERRAVISVSPENLYKVDILVDRIKNVLEDSNAINDEGVRLRLAALAQVIYSYIKGETSDEGEKG